MYDINFNEIIARHPYLPDSDRDIYYTAFYRGRLGRAVSDVIDNVLAYAQSNGGGRISMSIFRTIETYSHWKGQAVVASGNPCPLYALTDAMDGEFERILDEPGALTVICDALAEGFYLAGRECTRIDIKPGYHPTAELLVE